jgi:predicted nucleic acid-binding protein
LASLVVADSGIFLATVLVEPNTIQAKALVCSWSEQKVEVYAPTLFRYEIVAVMRKSVYQSRLTVEEAIRGRDFLLEYPVRLMMDDELLKRGYELATRLNRPTAYNSRYLAVAERLQCEFWTADERMFNAVTQDLNWVKWLGSFKVRP